MAGRKRRKDENKNKSKEKKEKRKTNKKKGEKKAKREEKEAGAVPTSRGWAALAELLGRRAAVRVLWELRDQPLRFRPLQSACDGLSPSTLNQRLAELREARLIALDERAGYALTPMGREVVDRLTPLAVWAEPWSRRRAQKRTPATVLRRQ